MRGVCLGCVVWSIWLTSAAWAAPVERPHSVNVGLGVNAAVVNYEHLFEGVHGLLTEGKLFYTRSGDTSTSLYGVLLGYRAHVMARQESLFVGLNLEYMKGTGAADGDEFAVTAYYALPNIGQRFVWDDLNLTWRAGLGYASREVSSNVDTPRVRQAVEDVQRLIDLLPVGFDAELSIGWVF